jgi:hypothetical protein
VGWGLDITTVSSGISRITQGTFGSLGIYLWLAVACKAHLWMASRGPSEVASRNVLPRFVFALTKVDRTPKTQLPPGAPRCFVQPQITPAANSDTGEFLGSRDSTAALDIQVTTSYSTNYSQLIAFLSPGFASQQSLKAAVHSKAPSGPCLCTSRLLTYSLYSPLSILVG